MSCFISDLSGASVSLSNPSLANGAFTAASLGGSTAILSVPASPSIDGKLLRLRVVVKVSDDGIYNNGSGTIFGGILNVGSTFSGSSEFASMSGTGVGAGVYSFEANCLWDSTTQYLVVHSFGGGTSKAVSSGNSNGNISGPGSGLSPFRLSGISAQTGIQFVFGAYWNNTTNSASATLLEFSLGLD